MNLQELIFAYREASNKAIAEHANMMLTNRPDSFEIYLAAWGQYQGLLQARALFDETVKKVLE